MSPSSLAPLIDGGILKHEHAVEPAHVARATAFRSLARLTPIALCAVTHLALLVACDLSFSGRDEELPEGVSIDNADGSEADGGVAGVTAGSAPPPSWPAGVMALSCAPGEHPAPCMLCDVSGQLITPLNDTSCPDLDCAAQSNYRIVDLEDGTVECRRQPLTNGPSQCQGLGACFSRAQYCQREVEEGFLEPIVLNDCRTIEGCDGQTEGSVVIRAGEPCDNGQGTCDEQGECSTSPTPAASCESVFGASFPQTSASRLCLNNNPQAPHLCDLLLNRSTNGNVRYSCLAVCAMHGAVCEAAWNDNGVCNPNLSDPQACEAAGLDSFVCRCRLP